MAPRYNEENKPKLFKFDRRAYLRTLNNPEFKDSFLSNQTVKLLQDELLAVRVDCSQYHLSSLLRSKSSEEVKEWILEEKTRFYSQKESKILMQQKEERKERERLERERLERERLERERLEAEHENRRREEEAKMEEWKRMEELELQRREEAREREEFAIEQRRREEEEQARQIFLRKEMEEKARRKAAKHAQQPEVDHVLPSDANLNSYITRVVTQTFQNAMPGIVEGAMAHLQQKMMQPQNPHRRQ